MDKVLDAVRVLVAVETRIYQEGIGQLLCGSGNTEAVAFASDEQQIVQACVEHSPDVLLLDATMPDSLGIARRVRQEHPQIRLILLAMLACQKEMMMFAREGVVEFLTRGDSLDDLCNCIDAAMKDGFWCSRRVADLLLQDSSNSLRDAAADYGGEPAGSLAALTPQQVRVLQYIESGLSNKSIARRMNIETATVKNHVHHILQRLGVATRGEAAATYRRANTA